jgi:hypothetical protein
MMESSEEVSEIELQDISEVEHPGDVITRLADAESAETATECLLMLSRLLDDVDMVKDGTIQQADVIRAAKLAKLTIGEDGWAEDEYRDLLYKFAESADATSREPAAKDQKVAGASEGDSSKDNEAGTKKKGGCCSSLCLVATILTLIAGTPAGFALVHLESTPYDPPAMIWGNHSRNVHVSDEGLVAVKTRDRFDHDLVTGTMYDDPKQALRVGKHYWEVQLARIKHGHRDTKDVFATFVGVARPGLDPIGFDATTPSAGAALHHTMHYTPSPSIPGRGGHGQCSTASHLLILNQRTASHSLILNQRTAPHSLILNQRRCSTALHSLILNRTHSLIYSRIHTFALCTMPYTHTILHYTPHTLYTIHHIPHTTPGGWFLNILDGALYGSGQPPPESAAGAPPKKLHHTLFRVNDRVGVLLDLHTHHTSPYLTIPRHTSPYLTIPHHTSPYLTIPHHTSPYLTIPRHTSPYLTIPHHTSPYLTILTIHQVCYSIWTPDRSLSTKMERS